jgi:diadenosine tetraphosphate (Ap4A) HIT family hydrolase
MSEYDNQNIFAKIIRGEIPCHEVYQDDKVLAFKDVTPAAEIHVLVIPKGEFVSFDDFVQKESSENIAHFFKMVQKIADDLGVDKSGYRIIANHGSDANQTVAHFHAHILAGENLGGLVQTDSLKR